MDLSGTESLFLWLFFDYIWLVSNLGASINVCFNVDMLSLVTVLHMAEFDLVLTFQAAFALRFGTKRSIW